MTQKIHQFRILVFILVSLLNRSWCSFSVTVNKSIWSKVGLCGFNMYTQIFMISERDTVCKMLGFYSTQLTCCGSAIAVLEIGFSRSWQEYV